MNDDNRYAPPKAGVEGATIDSARAPSLWNPNATANWSLLFTPMFGAWLQMQNWRALGERKRADAAQTWLALSTIIVAGSVFLDLVAPRTLWAALTTPLGFVWLLVWYFASGRPHARWVAARFGKDYPRQPWLNPLMWGLAGYVLIFALGALAGIVATTHY
jgi:hypothetical protein